MPLTVELRRSAEDRAEAWLGQTRLASFEPRALLVEQPLHPDYPLPVDPVAYGRRLWAALGGPDLQQRIAELPLAPDLDSLITIRTDDPDLAAIPWEYLHTGNEFLIFDYLLVREVPTQHTPPRPNPERPWRLVAQGSEPLLAKARDPQTGAWTGEWRKLSRLKVVNELDDLAKSLRNQQPPPPIRWHRIAPTRAAITNLAANEPLLFHYTGHGDVERGEPIRCFDDGMGRMDPRPVRDLAQRLRGRTYLAFLNACRTADSREPGANLAFTLVKGGIPVVLGSQYSVLDTTAAAFAWTFYQHLAGDEPQRPALALLYARQCLRDVAPDDPRQWAIPALYMASGYQWPQQRPAAAPLQPVEAPPLDTHALQAPDQLVGRENELVELATLYVKHNAQIVTIKGAGGMGKTALAGALARRLRFQFADGVVAITLALAGEQPRLSAAEARLNIAARLGFDAKAFGELGEQGQEEAIVNAVDKQQRLLIFDNYETVLWRLGRDTPDVGAATTFDEDQRREADAVQRLVTRLAKAGVHLLFTTRQSPVGLPGEVLYPAAERGEQLRGLDPDSAAEMFRQHAGTAHAYTGDFLLHVGAAVEYSPLLIELAATRWRDSKKTEGEFLQAIWNEIEQAKLEGVPEHQRSAVANVRLSINALPPDLRRDFLTLTIIANPLIRPIHGAVVWGLEDETHWFTEQAHERLERLRDSSLLQGLGWNEQRNWANGYTIQPVVAQVARYIIQQEALDLSAAQARYGAWIAGIVDRAHSGIDTDERIAREAQAALPDMLAALRQLPDEQRGWSLWRAARSLQRFGRMADAITALQSAQATAEQRSDQELLSRALHAMANVFVTRGDLPEAMRLYQQALTIDEQLGDIQGQSATLHAMANVFVTRGDLPEAMRLYQQALTIQEQLGDIQGQSATLHEMANVFVTRGDLPEAMRLYQQSLAIKQQLGDIQGQSATLHQMAYVFVTRGDLPEAMRLYQQSLAIKQQLGDIQGQSATLIMLAQLRAQQGDHATALANARESLSLFERLGATREIEQARNILAQIEQSTTSADNDSLSLAQLTVALLAATRAALRETTPHEQLRSELSSLRSEARLAPFVDALQQILDRNGGAAATALAALGPLLSGAAPSERRDAFSGLAAIAHELTDVTSEVSAREAAIAAQRELGADREALVQLSVMLYNLAGLYGQQGDHAAAVALLQEVVALDEQTGHPDLESDRAALIEAQRRAAGLPDSTLRDLISAWRDSDRDAEGLSALINLICNVAIETLRSGDSAARTALAEDIARLRMLRPLPIAGTYDFLYVLQVWLRGQPNTTEAIRNKRAALPQPLAQALNTMERLIANEPLPEPAPEAVEDEEAEMAAMLATLSPAQRAEFEVIKQVAPAFAQAAQLLRDPQTTAAECAAFAAQIEQAAAQAAEGEEAGSPWLDAAVALRALAELLRGRSPTLDGLPPMYRTLLKQVIGD